MRHHHREYFRIRTPGSKTLCADTMATTGSANAARAPPAPAPAKAATPAKRKAPPTDEAVAESSPAGTPSASASSASMFRRVERGVEYDVVVAEDGGYKRRRVGSVGKARQWHYFCPHGTRKERCKECGGSSICT